jgi:DNA-binding SARP family transcriptional activator
MSRLCLFLLGRFEAKREDGSALASPGGKGQALLAYLALPAGQTHLRDELAALLWGDVPAGLARRRLRQVIFELRRVLPKVHLIRLDGDGVTLDPVLVEADVGTFEAAVTEGTPEALELAARLYRGDLLAGLVIQAPAFEEWLAAERERLRERAIEALARLSAHQRAAGALDGAVDTTLRLLALDPLQEPVHRTLMRLYADLGRRGAALRQYQACAKVLEREMGVEPDVETKLLYEDVFRQARPDATPVPAGHTPASGREGTPSSSLLPLEGPLVGRAREQTRLHAALEAVCGGRGRVVAVLGETGIGKSRLAAELAAEAGRRGAGLLVGHAYQSEQDLPFGPWIDALRTGRVAADTDLFARLEPRLRDALGRLLLLPGTGQSGPMDPRELFEAVTHLVERAADRHPLLLVLEDIHWADEMSVRLLAFLGRRLGSHGALVLVTAREEELRGESSPLGRTLEELARGRHLEAVSLAPFSRAETAELVRRLAPRSAPADELGSLEEDVWRISEGNPFVVVETIESYRQGGGLRTGRSGRVLPDPVQAVVIQRLERLSDPSRRLAAAAAVIGRESDFPLVQRTANLPDDVAMDALDELIRRGLFRVSEERFGLAHERIRAVLYERLLPPRRALLHRRVAEALEARRGTADAPDPFTLGAHYQQAGAWDKAVPHLQEAAEHAAQRFAHREAAASSEAALAALGHLPDDDVTRARAFELRMLWAFSLVFLGEYEKALTHYDMAAGIAERLTDDGRLVRALAARVTPLAFLGRYAEARETGERAAQLAVSRGDLAGQAWAHLSLARVCLDTGDYPECERHARALTACQQGLPGGQDAPIPLLPPLLGDRYWLAVSYAMRGEFEQGLVTAKAMVDAAERLDRPRARIWAAYALARVYLAKGDAEDAAAILEPLLAQAREVEFWAFYTRIAWALGAAYGQCGRVAEALPLLEEAVAHARSTRFHSGLAMILAMRAKAYLLAGRLAEAEQTAEEALELARQMGERGNETVALRVLGEIAAERDPPDLARGENAFGLALALAAALGRRPTEAHCHLGLGTVYSRTGQAAAARVHLRRAAEAFRALGMTSWLARAEAALGKLGGES